MIAKLAVLAVEKMDGTIALQAGEKGEISELARVKIREANDNPKNDIARVTAFGSVGIIKERKWKTRVTEADKPAEKTAGRAAKP